MLLTTDRHYQNVDHGEGWVYYSNIHILLNRTPRKLSPQAITESSRAHIARLEGVIRNCAFFSRLFDTTEQIALSLLQLSIPESFDPEERVAALRFHHRNHTFLLKISLQETIFSVEGSANGCSSLRAHSRPLG
jgi:hypothetical protein